MKTGTRNAMLMLSAIGLSATIASADFVQPVGVSATSYWPSLHHTNLIDGSGLSAESSAATHDTTAGNIWHTRLGGWGAGSTSAPVVDTQSAIFDLGGVYDLTNAYIWNMNQASLGNARSIDQYDLDVSSDGVNWTNVVIDGNLTVAPGTGAVGANNVVFGATQTGVRFVRIGADTAYSGNASEYVGLSEVRFEGTMTAAGATPTATYASNTTLLPEAVSSTDLLQGKAATSSALLAGSVAQLTDGIGAPNGNSTDFSNRVIGADGSATQWQLDYSFGTIKRIDEINVFSFNTDGRRNLDFDVQYSMDFGATYQYLAIGAGNLGLFTGAGNTSVVNLDGPGAIAEFATDLRFNFRPINGLGSSLVEVDAIGSQIERKVTLQNGTATASQTNLSVDYAIDGALGSGFNTGWGNGTPGTFGDNVAVFETTEDVKFTGEAILRFTMDFTSFSDHGLGRFRLLATTADRDEFADGLDNGGDVDFTGGDTGSWFLLDDLVLFDATSGLLLSGGALQGDGSFLIDDILGPGSDKYTILLRTDLSGITGFRLEILDDASLTGGGPGLSNSNGNSVLTEFSVSIASVPAPAALPMGLVMLGAMATRRRRG